MLISRRNLTLLASFGMIGLIGCAPAGKETTSGAPKADAGASSTVKIGLITPGKVNDGGWCQLAQDSVNAIAKETGATVLANADLAAWLGTKGVDAKLEVIEWKPSRTGSFFLPSSVAQALGRALGVGDLSSELIKEMGADRLFLDGMLSLWQAEKAVSGG